MKAIINGKIYNTETATKLGNYEYGICGDLNHVYESLYRTKKNAYFLAGSGGVNTRYSRSCGDNTWRGGEKIIPVEGWEARKWMEKHCAAEEYIVAFDEPEEA